MNQKSEAVDVSALRAQMLAKMGEHAEQYPSQIERQFPHILAKLANLWGSPRLDEYLGALIFADRDGRQGFPPEVATEMFHLSAVHAGYGLRPKASGTGWSSIDDVAIGRKASNDDA